MTGFGMADGEMQPRQEQLVNAGEGNGAVVLMPLKNWTKSLTQKEYSNMTASTETVQYGVLYPNGEVKWREDDGRIYDLSSTETRRKFLDSYERTLRSLNINPDESTLPKFVQRTVVTMVSEERLVA